MRKYLCFMICLMLLFIGMSSAMAEISIPTVYCDGKKVSTREIVEYDIAEGSLVIKWDKQSDASKFKYKCIGLNEVPDFSDTNQAGSDNTLVDKEITKNLNNTSSRTFTVSAMDMKKYDYLKIAVGVFDADGNQRWCNFGVKLTNSFKAPSVFCAGEAVDHMEIMDYDPAEGTLTIKWTHQPAAKSYSYKCIGLNEKPDFYDENQADSGEELKSGKVTSNTASSCKFTVSKSQMQGFDYLKVEIAAYDSNGKAYWTDIGVRLVQESGSTLSLSESSLSMSYNGGSGSVTVSGASSYTVSYPTEDETAPGRKWLTVSKSGSTIKITARPNYGTSARSETITVRSSDGQTASIVVKQKAGYAAPTATIKIGSNTYSSGSTYGPLANGGNDTLWLTVAVKNAQRIYVGTNNTTIGHREVELAYSSTVTDKDCWFKIPAGLTPGIYTFTIYVSNSNVKDDQWAQAITPLTLNVQVVGDETSTGTSIDPIWPCASAYKITCMYYYVDGGMHRTRYGKDTAIDITGGGNIIAVADGTVKTKEDKGTEGFGKYIEIAHSDGTVTLYAHLASYDPSVSVGAAVKQGQVIGVMGDTGNSNGTHLHFEMKGQNPFLDIYYAKYKKKVSFQKNVYSNNNSYNSDKRICQIIDKEYTLQQDGYYVYSGNAASGDDPYPAYGSTLLAVAQSQIGYIGSATKDNQTGANVTSHGNWTKYGAYTGANPDEWCASFVSWCGMKAGDSRIKKTSSASPKALCTNYDTKGAIVYFLTLNKTQSTKHPYLKDYGIKGERSEYTPQPGDLIFFRWKTEGDETTFSHVGIVSRVEGDQVYYIDGNRSNDEVKERNCSLTDEEIAAYCKLTGSFSTSILPVETTFSGALNDLTVRLGEKAQLTGTVNLQGNTSIDRVTVNVRGYYDAADSRVFTRAFSDNLTTVKLENYAEFVVDTTVAPFNVAGSYTIRLWASGKDGTTLTQPIAEATVLVAEPVSALPSYTEDELFQYLYHTLGVNEGSYDTVNQNDNGSSSIGRIQWNCNAGNALPLLKNIVAKNPEDAHAILGESLYQEITNHPKNYWDHANRIFNDAETVRIKKLLATSYSIEVQEAQIRYDLTTTNLKKVRDRGVTDPWAIVYFADIINVGYKWLPDLIEAAVAEVGSVDKITLDVAHKVTQAHAVYGKNIYKNRLKRTYEYLKGITFDGKHYNDTFTADPYPPKGSTLLSVAKSQIGYKGSSSDSNLTGANVTSTGNYTKYGEYVGKNGSRWDAAFLSWCADQAGVTAVKKTTDVSPKNLCSNYNTKGAIVYFNKISLTLESSLSYMKSNGIKSDRSTFTPAAGDLIFFGWDDSLFVTSPFTHVGIVSKVSGGTVYYIDGDGDGEAVAERSCLLTDENISAYCKVSGSYNDTASAPTFDGYTALNVTDYDLSDGSLTIRWSASNADVYYVNAILLNEMPTVGDDSQAERAVRVIKQAEHSTNSLTLTVDDLTGGQYLKFAVGASSASESTYHWSWIGFKLKAEFGKADMTLPASLTAIADEAFYGMPVSSVYCPDGMKTIGAKAFANCKSLRKIRIPASVSTINANAFTGCTNLTIYGAKGSAAETYARNNGFTFIAE